MNDSGCSSVQILHSITHGFIGILNRPFSSTIAFYRYQTIRKYVRYNPVDYCRCRYDFLDLTPYIYTKYFPLFAPSLRITCQLGTFHCHFTCQQNYWSLEPN